MPLSNVVDYYNLRLPQLHTRAQLRHGASYRLERGNLTAQVAGLLLTPSLVPVHTAAGALFARRAQVAVQTADGLPTHPESLFVQAWDADDFIFLDCFLRTFHALNHLHQGHDGHESLVVDVNLRHGATLPAHDEVAFEALLNLLGLGPHQIVLRLDAQALHRDTLLQEAARRFAGRGYRLLAARPDLRDTNWDQLRALGVRWVAPDLGELQALHRRRMLGQWRQQHLAGYIGLWLDGGETANALARMRALGADLIEGNLPTGTLRPEPPHNRVPVNPWASSWASL